MCDILVIDMVTLVVNLFVDVVAALFYTVHAGFVLMVGVSVDVVPPLISPPI